MTHGRTYARTIYDSTIFYTVQLRWNDVKLFCYTPLRTKSHTDYISHTYRRRRRSLAWIVRIVTSAVRTRLFVSGAIHVRPRCSALSTQNCSRRPSLLPHKTFASVAVHVKLFVSGTVHTKLSMPGTVHTNYPCPVLHVHSQPPFTAEAASVDRRICVVISSGTSAGHRSTSLWLYGHVSPSDRQM